MNYKIYLDTYDEVFAVVEAPNAREAAENTIEKSFEGLDYPNDVTVICAGADGTVFKYYVDVIPVPTFSAKEEPFREGEYDKYKALAIPTS